MLKKHLIVLNLIIIIFLVTACDSDLLNYEKKISLQLSFPDTGSHDQYMVKIYAERDGGGVMNHYEYKDINSNEIFNKSLSINEKADFMMIYLFKNMNFTIIIIVLILIIITAAISRKKIYMK